MNKLTKIYRWKVLSDDGLLKEPQKIGPYYDEKELNGYIGYFKSEEDALKALEEWSDKYGSYVLVTFYTQGGNL